MKGTKAKKNTSSRKRMNNSNKKRAPKTSGENNEGQGQQKTTSPLYPWHPQST